MERQNKVIAKHRKTEIKMCNIDRNDKKENVSRIQKENVSIMQKENVSIMQKENV